MKALSFLRSINFGALKPWKTIPTKAAGPTFQQAEEQLGGELGYILPVTARKAGSTQSFHLLASHLTPNKVIFRTDMALKEHECLELEVLLQGVGNLCITAQVQFVVLATKTRVSSPLNHVDQVSTPMYSGQLELWSTDRQLQDIRNFMRRQTSRQRSTVSSGSVSV